MANIVQQIAVSAGGVTHRINFLVPNTNTLCKEAAAVLELFQSEKTEESPRFLRFGDIGNVVVIRVADISSVEVKTIVQGSKEELQDISEKVRAEKQRLAAEGKADAVPVLEIVPNKPAEKAEKPAASAPAQQKSKAKK
jgi:hypothetical protein